MNNTEIEVGREQDERPRAPSKKSPGEILGSLELTTAFLEGIPEAERRDAADELIEAMILSGEKDADRSWHNQEAEYAELIKNGLRGYLEQRSNIRNSKEKTVAERKKEIDRLDASYKCAQQLRQQFRARALHELIANFTNAFRMSQEGAIDVDTFYDPGYETATSRVNGRYESKWDPEVHFNKQFGKFFAKNDVKEIRKFIEGSLEQRSKIENLSYNIEEQLGRKIDSTGFDPRAAELILAGIKDLVKGIRLGTHTKVLISGVAFSVVLSDSDYDALWENEPSMRDSGGLAFSGTVITMVRDGYRTAKTIAHENEHILNDVLLNLHRAETIEMGVETVVSLDNQMEYKEEELEKIFEKVLGAMVNGHIGNSFFMTRFADEVLANKLGNKDRSNEEILKVLNESPIYDYLNVTESNIAKMDSMNKIRACFYKMTLDYDKIMPRIWGEENPSLAISRQISLFLTKKNEKFESHLSRLVNLNTIRTMREKAILQVDRLMNARKAPEEIRALLSSHNPLMWERIVDLALGTPDLLKESRESARREVRRSIQPQASRMAERAKRMVRLESSLIGKEEIPDEEKQFFKEILETTAQLQAQGYKKMQGGFEKDKFGKDYGSYLRKMKGDSGYLVTLHQSISNSEKENPIFEATIHVKVGRRSKEVPLSMEVGVISFADQIQAAIDKIEKEFEVK